jgi:thiol-disulfide isomerase/thioredoxin
MTRSTIVSIAASSLLLFGAAACTPSKEDQPPMPKVTAEVKPADPATPAAARSDTAAKRIAALPKLGAAPAWKLKDVSGKEVSSDQFKGKVVVVDFWATWCPPCRAEIPGYTELQKKYGKDGFAIVGISLDQAGPSVVKSFAEKFGVNYTMVMGDEAVMAAFGGVEALPTTFLIDRNGQIRDRKLGAEETAEYEKKIAAVMAEG